MIQRLASPAPFVAVTLLLAALSLVAGCAARTHAVVPRSLGGARVRGAFVPPTSYEAHVRGELLLAEGRAAEAVQAFERATTAPEEDPYLLSRLAHAQLLAGRRDDAQRTLDHAAELDPCSEAVWLTRGFAAERDHRPIDAQAAYERAAHCAPRSPDGLLALARLLQASGAHAAALDVLADAAERPFGARAEQALARSLSDADAAALAHGLASLSLHRAPHADTLESAIRLALARDLPRLALRAREQHTTRLSPALEAAVLEANGAREQLAALLAQRTVDELGGPEATARFALAAGAYERAELEATTALARGHSDALRVLRGQALLALDQPDAALADARAVRDPARRRSLLLELMAGAGQPALARELAAPRPDGT